MDTITLTQQTVLQPLMDLKISPLHDSVLPFTLQAASNNGRVSHESSDSESHISRLGYCFVSRHVISQFQTCTGSSLCTVVHALQRSKVTWSWAACVCIKSLQSLLFLPVTATLLKAGQSTRGHQAGSPLQWPCHYICDQSANAVLLRSTAGVILSGKAIFMDLILIKVQLGSPAVLLEPFIPRPDFADQEHSDMGFASLL